MAKQEWTVRVVQLVNPNHLVTSDLLLSGVWVEQLRYMGLAREIYASRQMGDDKGPERTVIEFYCRNPREYDSKVWADQNAERMRSFGINAAAAPKWDGHSRILESEYANR